MPDGLTITYKGNTLHSSTEDDTFTLNTSGKYMEDDITINATNVSSLDVTYNNSSLVSETSATGTWTLNTAGKLMEDDVSFDVVVTPPPYITFKSSSSFTLYQQTSSSSSSVQTWNGTLEYSTDKTTWTVWDGTQISSVNNAIYLRGTGNTKITATTGRQFVLSGTNIQCSGNIENLLDYTTVSNGGHPSMAIQCFQSLFTGNTSLVSAPELPATSLSLACYADMFSGCTALTHTPSLPASVVLKASYEEMFKGCTSLTNDIDLRHVTSITAPSGGGVIMSASGYIAPNTNISTKYSTSLTQVDNNAFQPLLIDTPTTVSNYFYFTDNDSVLFDATYIVTVGSDKGTVTNNIYTDNTTIKNAVLTKVDEYTIVNVYHLDGSDW